MRRSVVLRYLISKASERSEPRDPATICANMELKLQDLRRYAIENRVEIKFADSESRECLISNKGQVKIPGDDKDLRIEEALAAASTFEVIGAGKPQRFSREAMAAAIDAAFKLRGPAAVSKDEE